MASMIKAALLFLGLLGVAALVTGGVVLLVRIGDSPAAITQADVAEKTAPAEKAAALARGIPPIDAAAPAEVETATFALG